jgi:predicted transcriptional regulator
MKWQEIVMRYLSEASRKEAGYKSMAKSAGLSTGGAKAEIHKLERKGTIRDIKKRAKGATNPKAYLYGTERKILKQHAAKIGR